MYHCGLGPSYCPPPLNAVTELHLAAENNLIDVGEFYDMLQACAKPLITFCTLVRAWPLGTMNEVSELLLWISALDFEELTIASFIHHDLAALPPENPNNPKFPVLKSLNLAPAHAQAMGLAPMYVSACFSGIRLLILPNYYKQVLRLSFLKEDGTPTEPR